jgi:NAD(P)-dependent dehydrogenase (short-subunit alcohol dehydrogenase family)
MGRLSGKVAIVTGASAGIGRATAKLFAAEGAKLVLGARRKDELEQLVAEIAAEGGEALALAGDVRSEDYARALVALALERFGQLDVAFNNAGTLGESGPSTGVSEGRRRWRSISPARSWVRSTRSRLCLARVRAR